MAFAVRAAKLDQRRMLTWLLIGTALPGCVFTSIKGVEYHKDYVDHPQILVISFSCLPPNEFY
jgi:hypothetical protein